MTELDDVSKARAKKDLDKFFERHGINKNLPIHQQLVNVFCKDGKCCGSDKCQGHSAGSVNRIISNDLVSITTKKPEDGAFILLLIGGVSPPRLARYTLDGYFVQGFIGLIETNEKDLWIDISDLANVE